MLHSKVRIGCSGWNYRHWRGAFYPERLAVKRWFAFYAEQFDTVEINNSFYRLPTAAIFDAWRDQAPPGFCYAVKANRFLTVCKISPSKTVGGLSERQRTELIGLFNR